jgi:acyl-coenzyme A synthetase/AMP-(fatty) acid ligase
MRYGFTHLEKVRPLSRFLRLFFETELPRNAMGKVQKSALRASYSGIFLKRH